MSGRYYDVIVLGRSVGALLAAALLARRNFSVLVLGQGSQPAEYRWGELPLRRRPFSFLGASSPALRRVLVELAQSQTFRRRHVALDPMLTILQPDRRFELAPDLTLFEREMDREFPEVRRSLDDLYATLAGVNEAADRAFGHDLVWPPGTFWERYKTGRAVAELPFLHDVRSDIFSDFPLFHPYRGVLQQTVVFAADLATTRRPLPAFAVARLHAAWTRGLVALPGGEDELVQFLVDRITAHGGTVSFEERAEKVLVQRDGVAGVQLDGHTSRTGCRFLVSNEPGEQLATLAQGAGITPRARAEWPQVVPTLGRYVLSLVVRRDAIPEPLGAEALLFAQPPATPAPDPHRPTVHLQRTDGIGPADHVLLVAETLLPLHGSGLAVPRAREAVLGTLRHYFPWLEQHLLVLDSPHDGLSVWAYENGLRRETDRVHLTGGSLRPEPMEHLYDVESPLFFGLAGEPVRGPIPRTFLLGKTVLPALGQEGEMLAAWSVARLVTQSDRRRDKLRLELWNKVEIG